METNSDSSVTETWLDQSPLDREIPTIQFSQMHIQCISVTYVSYVY